MCPNLFPWHNRPLRQGLLSSPTPGWKAEAEAMSISCFGSCRREGREAGMKNVLSLSCCEHPLAMVMLKPTVGRGEPGQHQGSQARAGRGVSPGRDRAPAPPQSNICSLFGPAQGQEKVKGWEGGERSRRIFLSTLHKPRSRLSFSLMFSRTQGVEGKAKGRWLPDSHHPHLPTTSAPGMGEAEATHSLESGTGSPPTSCPPP